jgi:hypothetical protein
MAAVRNERPVVGEKPRCPHCEDIELRRQGRVGLWQRAILPQLGLYPWECGLCRKIFYLRQRSTGYRQHSVESSVAANKVEFMPVVEHGPGLVKPISIEPMRKRG